jgi:hypothetical protein
MHQLGSITTAPAGYQHTSMAKCSCGAYFVQTRLSADDAEKAIEVEFNAHKQQA